MDYLVRWIPVFGGAAVVAAYAFYLDRKITKDEERLANARKSEGEQLPLYKATTTGWKQSA